MSSPDRRTFLLSALALGACGFTPAYGPGGSGAALLGQVRAEDPSDPDQFAYNRRISERLGRAAATARFALATKIEVSELAQGITPDQAITRYSLNGTADFTLTDTTTGAVVTQGRVSSFTSHSATGTTVATLAAERDARERLMRMLADQVITRLIAAGAT